VEVPPAETAEDWQQDEDEEEFSHARSSLDGIAVGTNASRQLPRAP
jgi:hypothetical protein